MQSGEVTLVDDSEEFRFFMSIFFEEEMGLRTLGLASLAEVKTQIQRVMQSQAVVLDINLGAGQPDGVEVFRWLKEQGYTGTVFFMTGHAKSSPYVSEAAATGVRILEKPMSAQDLVSEFKALLQDSRTEKRLDQI